MKVLDKDCLFWLEVDDQHRKVQTTPEHIPTDRSKYECFECDYSANSKDEMRIHVHSQHSLTKFLKESYFECYECDFTTKGKNGLSNHVKAKHSTIKIVKENFFECHKCEFSYKSKSD